VTVTIDRIQVDARVVDGMTREFAEHPGWLVRQPRTVPDRSIGDAVVYADCPGCGWAVPVGFGRNDPGAATRTPEPCRPCQEAEAQAGPAEQETSRDELELTA
jgi:hypothetical protein